jgi:multiple sugar transport system ATP-binding protein
MVNIKLNSVAKKFGNITAVDNMNLEIKDKEFFILLGPTGAGKTTTLRLIAGLEKQDSGDIFLEDINVNTLGPALRDVAFVFQYYTLYPNYTVRQNLEFPLKSRLRRMTKEEREKKIKEVSEVLHIEHLLDRSPINLSGGEMQRVSIGKAIVRAPKIFLMDEPLSNLDAKLREEMRVELARIHMELGATFLYVTHDQIEAMTMGDRVAILNEGKILQIGKPKDIYEKPIDVFVAKFVGSPMINILTAIVEDGKLKIGENGMVCNLSEEECKKTEKYSGEKILFGIRPEDVIITKEKLEKNSFEVKVHFSQSTGAENILNLDIANAAGVYLRAITPPKILYRTGDTVFANLNFNRAHLFDSHTEKLIV